MSWTIEGTYFENCSCDFACPCTVTSLASFATQERCEIMVVYHVAQGEIDGLDVGGLSVVLIADAPRQMTQGKWRVGLIIDAGASKEQADRLEALFMGRIGGPPSRLARLFGEVLGVQTQPVVYDERGREHHLKVGGDVDVTLEDYIPEGLSEPTRLVGVVHPSNTTLTVGRPTSSRIKAFGLEFHNSGKSGFSAPYRWSG